MLMLMEVGVIGHSFGVLDHVSNYCSHRDTMAMAELPIFNLSICILFMV
jgi:hypothetical protein